MASVSQLRQCITALRATSPGQRVHLLKSDFRSAYRSIPISTDDLEAADVFVVDPDSADVLASTQYSMPFGAVGAVYSWDWVSDALVAILHTVFLLPASKYARLASIKSSSTPLFSCHMVNPTLSVIAVGIKMVLASSDGVAANRSWFRPMLLPLILVVTCALDCPCPLC